MFEYDSVVPFLIRLYIWRRRMFLSAICPGGVAGPDDGGENGGDKRHCHVLIPGRFCLYRQ